MIHNGINVESEEHLEELILNETERVKTTLRNVYHGTNNPIQATQEDLILLEKRLYEKRQADGRDAINTLMSELRLSALQHPDPVLAREVNRQIEIAFEKVTQNILLGWWITAKEQCELVQVIPPVTQELKDRVHTTITNYIANNY